MTMQSMANQIHPPLSRNTSYQLTLRAVGQVLDLLHAHSFEIEVSGKDLVVHGVSEKSENQATFKAMGFKNLVKIFRPNRVTGRERQTRKKAPRPFAFSGMRFSEEDLDRLELRGQASRMKFGGTPAFNTLSQALRALGAHIDHKRASLTRVSGCDDQIAIAYKLPLGGEKIETFTRINLYDLWVHMYKRRRQDGSLGKTPIRRTA
jgi:hypothetical protein